MTESLGVSFERFCTSPRTSFRCCCRGRRVVAVPRLAASADRRQAGDAHSMASKRVPAVLAVQIERERPAADSSGAAAAHCDDGSRESDMGRGADCRPAAREARHPSLSANGQAVYAVATIARETGNTSMEYIPAEPPWSVIILSGRNPHDR
jgi:hypothetical protein